MHGMDEQDEIAYWRERAERAEAKVTALFLSQGDVAAARNALGALARRFTQPCQIGEVASRIYAEYIDTKLAVGSTEKGDSQP